MAVSFHTGRVHIPAAGQRRITAWIKEVITAEGYSPGDIAYIFCSPEYHIGINRQYLGHDYHTDVITFDYSDLNGTRNISGDIFIDYTVRSNAETIGTQPQEEMMRVIIHGVLHLCGHGDKTPEEERAMRALEDRSLAAYRQANGRLSSVRTAGPVRERPPKGKKYHRHGKGLFPPFQAHSIHRRTSTRRPVFPTGKALLRVQESVPPATCIFPQKDSQQTGRGEKESAHTARPPERKRRTIQRTDRPRQGQERRMTYEYDIIVVGGGHAGCEAAAAAAKLGAQTLLITMDMGKFANMSCNPAVGGVAKGQIVREIDALGGHMGIITDRTAIQFRMLNRSKGSAMWSPRAQCDKARFSESWRQVLENTENLRIWQDTVDRLTVEKRTDSDSELSENQYIITGVHTIMGVLFKARAVILTNGTFLNGLMHTGRASAPGGRAGDGVSYGLTEYLCSLGFEAAG